MQVTNEFLAYATQDGSVILCELDSLQRVFQTQLEQAMFADMSVVTLAFEGTFIFANMGRVI